MLLALAVTLLSQAPARPVAVFATSKRPAVDPYISALTARAHALLKREGVTPLFEEAAGLEQLKLAGVTDPRTCQGGRACVARLALILGPRAVVVGIDVGKAGASLAVVMEAVAADTGKPVHTSEFEVPIATYSDASALPVTLFARELKAKLDAERPAPPVVAAVPAKPPPDAPVVAQLAPQPAPAAPVLVVRRGPNTQSVLGLTSLGLGVAGLASTAGLLIVGTQAQAEISRTTTCNDPAPGCQTSLPRSRAEALANQANSAFTGALISGIATGVFTVLAIVLFASNS